MEHVLFESLGAFEQVSHVDLEEAGLLESTHVDLVDLTKVLLVVIEFLREVHHLVEYLIDQLVTDSQTLTDIQSMEFLEGSELFQLDGQSIAVTIGREDSQLVVLVINKVSNAGCTETVDPISTPILSELDEETLCLFEISNDSEVNDLIVEVELT